MLNKGLEGDTVEDTKQAGKNENCDQVFSILKKREVSCPIQMPSSPIKGKHPRQFMTLTNLQVSILPCRAYSRLGFEIHLDTLNLS